MNYIRKDSYVNAVKIDVALISGLMFNFIFNCEEVYSAQDIFRLCTGQSWNYSCVLHSVQLLS